MAKPLRVDPIDLHVSADHVDVHHAEFRAAHASADADIEVAQSGWVGASAAALHARVIDWQLATTRISSEIEAHGAAFRAAAQGYTSTDTDSAGSLDARV